MIKIDYNLTGAGWAECSVESDHQTITISASYLGDALGDLASAVVEILSGQDETRASFWEEPGEYRWIFKKTDSYISLTIIEFNELMSKKKDNEGNVIFQKICTTNELQSAMKECLDRVLVNDSPESYKDKWVEHDFPSEAHAKLGHMNRPL
jgi:hypothetical protein